MSLTLKTPALLGILVALVALAFVSNQGRRTARTTHRPHVGAAPKRAESIFQSSRPKARASSVFRSREEMNDELREIVHDGLNK